MVLAAVLAHRNVKSGRGDRRGAFRAASIMFVLKLVSWLLGSSHIGLPGRDVQRFFAMVGSALFGATLLWLTYLGLEPYVRRFSPDSLIGWTRALNGQWRDTRVATDVLIGICAGLAMTVLFGVHNVLPPLAGFPEPTPLAPNLRPLLGLRYVLGAIVGAVGNALSQGMLAVVGIVALLMLLKRTWLAALVGAIIYTPVVINGMFNTNTPLLDIAIGAAIISILIFVIMRFGLLASLAAIGTHFVLLRAPLTTDLSSWRGSIALWYVGVIAATGFAACYIARTALPKLPRLPEMPKLPEPVEADPRR